MVKAGAFLPVVLMAPARLNYSMMKLTAATLHITHGKKSHASDRRAVLPHIANYIIVRVAKGAASEAVRSTFAGVGSARSCLPTAVTNMLDFSFAFSTD